MDTVLVKMLCMRDPLFAAEGMDLDRAETVLNEIESALQPLERVLAHRSFVRKLFFVRYPLARYAVPLTFLRNFVESERLRRDCVASPNATAMHKLVSQWKRCANALRDDLYRFRGLHRVLEGLEKDTSTFKFQDMFGNISTLNDVHATIDRFAKNADAVLQEVEAREKALASDSYEQLIHKAEEKNEFAFMSTQMTTPQKKLHELARTHATPFARTDILEEHGPLQYVLPHFDGKPTAHAFMLYRLREKKSGIESIYIALLDRFLFLRISDGAKGKRGFGTSSLKLLIEHGIPYWYQPLNLYTMRDQQFWADIATIVDLQKRPEINGALVRAQKSSMFDLMLGCALKDIYSYTAHSVERINIPGARSSYSLLFGLLMHDHPSIYFAPFNKSVWRLPEALSMIGSARATPEQYPYEDGLDVMQNLDDETLLSVMRAARIREDLREKAGYDKLPYA